MPDRLAPVLAALALVVSLVALGLTLRTPAPDEDAETAEAGEAAEHEEEGEELAHHMAYVQRYAEKLYFAGLNDNTALAQFYIEELEETFEAVEHGGYVEEGHALDSLVAALALPALEGVERAVAAEALSTDAAGARALFEARFAQLAAACNSCHETTGHGYVHIVVPAASSFPTQDFRPAGADRLEEGG